MEAIITTKDLKFMDFIAYPDIEIQKGKATFICGESGLGKSTLLKLFNGVVSPSEGTINYLGTSVHEYDTVSLRQEVLLSNQSVFLFDESISKNFDEYYDYRELPHLTYEEKEKFLKICCLDMPLDTECQTMSGGEKQRAFTAICLSLQPEVLMLDEPTAALDEANAENLLSNVKSYCMEQGITLIVVCHNLMLAEKFADKIIFPHKDV